MAEQTITESEYEQILQEAAAVGEAPNISPFVKIVPDTEEWE